MIKNKVTSRNSKTGDLYTCSVPNLGTEKMKTAKEMSSVASTEIGEKKQHFLGSNAPQDGKQKLLKDASIALAMSGQAVNKKPISNP